MTIDAEVGPLLLCSWMDELGRFCRRTYAPNELVLHDPGHLTWLRAFIRLAPHWRVFATC